jgi:hypothetical protein
LEDQILNTEKIAVRRIEAAAMLSISPGTLDRLTHRGLVKCVPGTGGTRGVVKLYSVAELKRFVAQGFEGKNE